MTDLSRLSLPIRLTLLFAGTAAITAVIYLAGRVGVPLTNTLDRSLTVMINPDHYLPFFDQFFRALTDYTTFLIAVPMVSWLIAYGLLLCLPKHRALLAGALVLEMIVLLVLMMMGRLWPNSTYTGVHVLFGVGIVACFGGAAYLFHTLAADRVRAVSRLIGLVLVSALLLNLPATNFIKSEIARPRPMNMANTPWNAQLRPIPDELVRGANSFPSGHTSGTFALLTPVFWFVRDRRARAGLLIWCVLQGLSRVYTVAHFPFCCMAGGVLGFTIGTMVFFLLRGPSLRADPAPAPVNG